MSLTDLARLLELIDQLPLWTARITTLEAHVATQAETIARIDTITNNIADDQARLIALFRELQEAQASGSQAAVEAAMDALGPSINNLEQREQQLRTIGANPRDPAPASLDDVVNGAPSGGNPEQPNPSPGSDTSASAGTAT